MKINHNKNHFVNKELHLQYYKIENNKKEILINKVKVVLNKRVSQ